MEAQKNKMMTVLAIVFTVGAIAMGAMAFNYYSMAQESNENYERNYQKSQEAFTSGNVDYQAQYDDFSKEDLNSYNSNKTTAMTYGGGSVLSLIIAGGLFWKRKK